MGWVTLEDGQHIYIGAGGEFQPRGPTAPRGPSLREQAAAHRAGKGSPELRSEQLAGRAGTLRAKIQQRIPEAVKAEAEAHKTKEIIKYGRGRGKLEKLARARDVYEQASSKRADLSSRETQLLLRASSLRSQKASQDLGRPTPTATHFGSSEYGHKGLMGSANNPADRVHEPGPGGMARTASGLTSREKAASSLREQAAAARAGKGPVAARAERLMNLAANRGGKLGEQASKIRETGVADLAKVTGYSGKVERGSYSGMTQKIIGRGDAAIAQAKALETRASILGKRAGKIYEAHVREPAAPARPAAPSLREQAATARAGKDKTGIEPRFRANLAKDIKTFRAGNKDIAEAIKNAPDAAARQTLIDRVTGQREKFMDMAKIKAKTPIGRGGGEDIKYRAMARGMTRGLRIARGR